MNSFSCKFFFCSFITLEFKKGSKTVDFNRGNNYGLLVVTQKKNLTTCLPRKFIRPTTLSLLRDIRQLPNCFNLMTNDINYLLNMATGKTEIRVKQNVKNVSSSSSLPTLLTTFKALGLIRFFAHLNLIRNKTFRLCCSSNIGFFYN